MDKKITTAAGIALGATLLAGAGFAAYKYLRQKWSNDSTSDSGTNVGNGLRLDSGFVGNGLVKSMGLYEGGIGDGNGLVGGGLYKS